jgi:pimeloyl-ACP methyl ester carboxylesterase
MRCRCSECEQKGYEEMSDSFSRRSVDAGPQEVVVREHGSGAALWYFHDEASAAPGPVAESLAQHFRVIAPIHPGFADAARPGWVERAEDVADVYVDAVDAITPQEPLVLVGTSVGGWIATELALLLGDRVSSLVLIGPLGLRVRGISPADHWFMHDDRRDRALYADPTAKPEIALEEFIANEGMIARMGWNPRLASDRLAPRLHRVKAPALVLWGARDALLDPVYAERWSEALPDARHALVEGAGHFPVHERPDDVAREAADFLLAQAATTEGANR